LELVQKLTSTRAGTIALAGTAALVAGISILVYLNGYRNSVNAEGAPVTVLVAKGTIPKGTPGAAIAASGLFAATTIRQSQLRDGAYSDPGILRGKVASHDIYAQQQLTAADFTSGATSVASTLTKTERVVSIPLDSAHGVTSQLEAGDHVDVFAGFNVIPVGPAGTPLGSGQARPMLRLVMQDVPVVAVAKSTGGSTNGGSANVSVRVNDRQAAELAFASDNGKLWLALRPASGAKAARPGIVTVETMLLGIRPVQVIRSFGGRG
jgi:Flp pilus assembly protein CpaB